MDTIPFPRESQRTYPRAGTENTVLVSYIEGGNSMAPKRTPPVRPHGAAGAIIKELEPLTYRRSASQVFDDWLAVTEASLVMLPHHARSVAAGKGMAEDPEPVQQLWEHLRQVYDKGGWERLQQAFAHLLDSTGGARLGMHYQDMVGEVFMDFGQPSDWSGQYFTPYSVAQMMVNMTMNPEEVEKVVKERLRHAILAAPDGEVLLMAWMLARARGDGGIAAFSLFAEQLYPQIHGVFQPYTIADPCCGSGVMLVAAMSVLPAWLTAFGLVEYHGTDIDARCVRMAHVNLMLHGAASFVVRHQDTLTLQPDFTPPRVGRVRWSGGEVLLPGKVEPAPVLALPPVLSPRESALIPSTTAAPPDVVQDLTALTQLTLDL
jgi:hypothetical protein